MTGDLADHQPRIDAVWAAPAQLIPAERLLLFGLVFGLRPKRVLEIGTYLGGSAVIIGAALDGIGEGTLTCIDPLPQVAPEHWALIEHRATLHQVSSPDGLRTLPLTPDTRFDFAFIDGDHAYDGVVRDIEGVMPVLADRAVMVFHDALHAETGQAIDDMVRAHPRQLQDCGVLSTQATVTRRPDDGSPVNWGGLRMLRFVRGGVQTAAAADVAAQSAGIITATRHLGAALEALKSLLTDGQDSR